MFSFLRRFCGFLKWAWFASKAEDCLVTLSRAMDSGTGRDVSSAVECVDESAMRADLEWSNLFGSDDGSKAREAVERLAREAGFDGGRAGEGAARAVSDGSRSQGLGRMLGRTAAALAMADAGMAKTFSKEPSEMAKSAMEGFLEFSRESAKWGGAGMMDRQRLVSCLRGVGMRMASLLMSGGREDVAEAQALVDVCRRFWISCMASEDKAMAEGLRPVPVAARLILVQVAMAAEELGEISGNQSLAAMSRDLMLRVTRGGIPRHARHDLDTALLPMRALEFARRSKRLGFSDLD